MSKLVNNAVVLPPWPVRSYHCNVEIGRALKEFAKERRRFIRDPDNLVRCLTIEFKIELGLRSAVVPVGKKFEFAPPQASLRQRGASDGDAHARRLPGEPAFFCDRFGRGNDAARDETWSAFVLAREDKDRIAFGDVLATIHRLLRVERERLRPQVTKVGFDREHHTRHLALLIPCPSMGLWRWVGQQTMRGTEHYSHGKSPCHDTATPAVTTRVVAGTNCAVPNRQCILKLRISLFPRMVH